MQKTRWAFLFIAAALSVAAGGPARAEQAAEKVALQTQDVDSSSGCTIQYDLKAAGTKALLQITYVAKAEHIGKPAGRVEQAIVDFKQSTLTWLDHQAKTYEIRQLEGLRNVPFARMLELLRAKGAEALKSAANFHGTMYEGKTVATQVLSAEKNAQFKPELLNVPANYKEKKPEASNLNSHQPGSNNGDAGGFTGPGGTPIPGGGGASTMP